MFDRDHFRDLFRRLAEEPEPQGRLEIIRELIAILQTEQKEVSEKVRDAIGH